MFIKAYAKKEDNYNAMVTRDIIMWSSMWSNIWPTNPIYLKVYKHYLLLSNLSSSLLSNLLLL